MKKETASVMWMLSGARATKRPKPSAKNHRDHPPANVDVLDRHQRHRNPDSQRNPSQNPHNPPSHPIPSPSHNPRSSPPKHQRRQKPYKHETPPDPTIVSRPRRIPSNFFGGLQITPLNLIPKVTDITIDVKSQIRVAFACPQEREKRGAGSRGIPLFTGAPVIPDHLAELVSSRAFEFHVVSEICEKFCVGVG
ncbi:hypothetical protein [uncultured Maritimibacter sp.]|uniref:hypothetical protein n=1 Tax=uncultured Maritimibacter sp. TaxID=991866 RepID=UPI002593C5BA|nr:hypothetical protein [uncultured Maritimibacter sp.]